ncbi:MAG: hypothetical protein U9R15_11440, partial [Chloroflexota bacterium]|nr:hypothetical protein [Chloroflexota bacterium]
VIAKMPMMSFCLDVIGKSVTQVHSQHNRTTEWENSGIRKERKEDAPIHQEQKVSFQSPLANLHTCTLAHLQTCKHVREVKCQI